MIKIFFVKIGILTVLITSTIAIFFVFPIYYPSDREGFLSEYSAKKKLLTSLSSPKIIVIGGSNVAFGIDSELMRARTGYQTVNMGLQAGLGLRFMMQDVLPHIKKGDIVILSPEYEQFGNIYEGGVQNALLYTTVPASALSMSSVNQVTTLASHLLTIIQVEIKEVKRIIGGNPITCSEQTGIYCKNSFNEWGDLVRHRTEKSHDMSNRDISIYNAKLNTDTVEGLTRFVDQSKHIGALVLYSFPPLNSKNYDKNSTTIHEYEVSVRNIPHLIVLDHPIDNRYNEELFFDTEYHLNATGTRIRTEKIISNLSQLEI